MFSTTAEFQRSRISKGLPNSPARSSMERGDAGKPASRTSSEPSLGSFNQLVLDYQDAAYNFAYYLLGDPDLAEDVTQKAFINAYHSLASFQGASFRSWLLKIVKNACYDEFRRPSYRKNTSLDAMETEDEWRVLPVETKTPESEVERIQDSKRIQQAIQAVEEPFRTILILVDLQGFDYEEAAQVTGSPVGTVKSRLARARLKFRTLFERL